MISIEGYSDVVRIGQGGLGDVYRATRASTGGFVAIKVLRDVSDESVVWHRTRRGATALVSLAGHANVIQLLEMIDVVQGPALVMEFAPGGSVADLMQRRGTTLSVAETVLVGRHTASALQAAHEQGIVHRDVKPQNLLIDAYGQVKLCDFGIAALTRTDDFGARTSALSMRYASPEDLDDDIDVGPPADVYSLGATLLHLARGAPPTLKERLAPGTPPASSDADAAALDQVIADCLLPDPSARPPASAVLDELERLGWALDERQRSLAFEVPDDDLGTGAIDDAPTGAPSSVSVGEEPTVVRDVAPPPIATAEPTVRRPAEPAPLSVPSRPPPGRSWWPAWVALVVAAATLLLLVLLGPLGGDDDAEPADSTVPATDDVASSDDATVVIDVAVELVERPAGLPDVTTGLWPFGDVDECLVQVLDEDELAAVPCDAAHDLQRIHVAELDAERFPPGSSFAQSDSRVEIRAACENAFASYTGVDLDQSVLEAPFTMPSEASWDQGDRRFQCMVFAPGRRIVGDAGG